MFGHNFNERGDRMARDPLTREWAEKMDQTDELSSFRKEFYIQEGTIYLNGNSLGLLSKRAEASLHAQLESWQRYGIDGWTQGKRPWFFLAESLRGSLAPLVGAKEHEVIVTGSTTVNIHQLLATFFRPQGQRTKIVADALTFPSDIYALQSQLRLFGLDPETHLIQVQSRDGRLLDEEEIVRQLTDEVALVLLPTVLYGSGQRLDIERVTKAAHERGIMIGWDACHSIGAMPHEFHRWGVDFAVWCSYKYLNSGPGSVGGLFVHEKHLPALPGLAGWFGSDKERQFDMEHTFVPAGDAGAFQIGTPHILSMAPIAGSLELFAEAGIDRIRAKSLRLTNYLMALVDGWLAGMGFEIANPREDERRGGHVALVHPDAVRICKALKVEGVIPDFRAPDMIRLAPTALYTSFVEVWEAVNRLKRIMTDKTYEQFPNKRGVVA
jgi:kynureninase